MRHGETEVQRTQIEGVYNKTSELKNESCTVDTRPPGHLTFAVPELVKSL